MAYWTVKQLAQETGLEERTIIQKIHRHEIEARKLGGRGKWMISSSEIDRLLGQHKVAEDLLSAAKKELKAQLFVPDPETVLIDDFGEPGHNSISLSQDVFRVIWQELGYDISQFKAFKERSWTSQELEVNVIVSPYCTLELFCPVEEHPLFQKLLSSLSAREQFFTWKQRGGQYLTMCSDIRREIHADVSDRTPQSIYETATQILPKVFSPSLPPPLTANFGNLVYQLCILYRRSAGQPGLPDKELYRIRRRGPFFSELHLGRQHLATAPNPPPIPPPPPPSTEWPHILEGWVDVHREMIMKWSASPDIIQLLELFESLRGIEGVIKAELDHRDSKR